MRHAHVAAPRVAPALQFLGSSMSRGTSQLLDRALRPFSKVRPGEGLLAFLMLACVFLILTSYYVMKTAREGLILATHTRLPGEELKAYATGAMAIVLAGVVPAYGALANRVKRITLINVSYAIVIASLVVFYLLGRAGVEVGIPFFVWLGLVSVFLVAQFWSYANDLYTEEQGRRLFAIIAIGGAAGAIIGPRVAQLADTFGSMLIAVAILVACVVLFGVIERVHVNHVDQAKQPIGGAGGFSLVMRDRYLILIAALLFVASLVNTIGEYMLSSAAADHAKLLVPGDAHAPAVAAARREMIRGFYADFFFWVNAIGFIVQAFLVSRVIEYLGVRRTLFVPVFVALLAYGMVGAIGGLAIIRLAKIADNSTDYSLQNTVRQTLFLPTRREVKYKAKAAIDTFFVRAGDLLAALIVGVGIHELGFRGRELAFVNLGLALVWLAIAAGIVRHHRALTRKSSEPVSSSVFDLKPQVVLRGATS
jgi:AAA family ATP:ADP antiporter